jgi:hypothetical protein
MLDQSKGLKSKLAGVQAAELGELVGTDAPSSGTTPPTTLTSIAEWLDSLAQAVDGADAAPTPDAMRGFATVSAALDAIEPRWKAFAASVQ